MEATECCSRLSPLGCAQVLLTRMALNEFLRHPPWYPRWFLPGGSVVINNRRFGIICWDRRIPTLPPPQVDHHEESFLGEWTSCPSARHWFALPEFFTLSSATRALSVLHIRPVVHSSTRWLFRLEEQQTHYYCYYYYYCIIKHIKYPKQNSLDYWIVLYVLLSDGSF